MNQKTLKLELKEVSDEGRFVGLAAVYGNKDLGGDVLMPGALTKSIKDRGGRFPLLYGHKINVGVSVVQDSREGLVTEGILNLEKQAARDVYSDLKFYKSHGMDFGMSIGYIPFPEKTDYKDGTTFLREIALVENTLTEFPMNPLAKVTEVKSLLNDLDAHIQQIKDGKASLEDFPTGLKSLIALRMEDSGAAPQPVEPEIDHSKVLGLITEAKGLSLWTFPSLKNNSAS